jgi:pimeloyl-ACP methyl ester carboxylesterase
MGFLLDRLWAVDAVADKIRPGTKNDNAAYLRPPELLFWRQQIGSVSMRDEVVIVRIRDAAIRLHRAGKGEPVLFLHGAGGYGQWLPFFDALAGGYELLVPEHPGFDGSDDPPWIRNVSDMAMFYLDFIEALGLERVHLIGHSLGGWIGAEILVRDRARFRSASFLAPAGIRVEGIPAGDIFIWAPDETMRNLFHNQVLAEAVLALPLTEEQQDIQLKNRFTATKLGWQPRWFNPDLERWLHRIKLPSLVLWGENDKVMPAAYSTRWRERLPDARLVTIAECGHLPHIEKAEQTADHVRGFLKGVSQ